MKERDMDEINEERRKTGKGQEWMTDRRGIMREENIRLVEGERNERGRTEKVGQCDMGRGREEKKESDETE